MDETILRHRSFQNSIDNVVGRFRQEAARRANADDVAAPKAGFKTPTHTRSRFMRLAWRPAGYSAVLGNLRDVGPSGWVRDGF